MMNTSVIGAVAMALLLSACGKNEEAAQSAPSPAPAAPAPAAPVTQAPTTAAPSAAVGTAVADNALGSSIYNKVCALCHAAGVGGAPRPGDKADWGPRIGQGKDVLYRHALEGFTGQKGMMPPRGANPALKDEEVKAAVDFMVSKSE